MSTAITQASQSSVGTLFRERARLQPEAIALEMTSGEKHTYRTLNDRTNKAAWMLREFGVRRGDRVAVLSENRPEYLELQLACAKLGVAVACQNYRLAPLEVKHCVELVAPKVVVVSERYRELWRRAAANAGDLVTLGDDYEQRLGQARDAEPDQSVTPEDPFLILYTSGTTGLPKGAVISQRAELARFLVVNSDLGLRPTDTPIVWPPLFHMVGAETALNTLLGGGKVVLVDGLRPDEIAHVVGREPVGWLALLPGTVEAFSEALQRNRIQPASVKLCGAMPDLVPSDQIARVTKLLQAPFLNSFGSTETGAPPATANVIPIGAAPSRLPKKQNSYCELRLVDPDDQDVPAGAPGELAMRGPTLFSGYWNAAETNERDFRGGWFHMGDVLRRNRDGTLEFVDRVKYLIKSGGENIYPAEIERVLMGDSRVLDAVVIRQLDPKWGEIPVAVIACDDTTLTAEDLVQRCRSELAGYKRPRDFIFVKPQDLPRSTTGKIQRHEIEAWRKTLGE